MGPQIRGHGEGPTDQIEPSQPRITSNNAGNIDIRNQGDMVPRQVIY